MDRIPHLDEIMSQLAVQTLTVGCYSTLGIGVLSPGCLIAFALLPAQEVFAVLLHAPFLVVVLGIVGASLAVHLALQSSFFAGIGL